MSISCRKLIVFAVSIIIGFSATAQSSPKGYFRNPLNIPMELVANLGEIRTNHWHMGLDIRTQQRVNLPVHAAADGYVARVGVEPGGFGQVIYINHPNGYTTLYAHLNAFYPALAKYVEEQQYKQQSWQVKLELPPNLFPVKKGDFIAWSGSTGGSQGPHVHFEIRDTKTDNCLNPLMFGLPIGDAVAPTIYRVGIYDRSKSVYDQTPRVFGVKKSGSHYILSSGSTITTGSNQISFAIGAIDRLNPPSRPIGIYSATVSVDGVPQSGFALDNISYDVSRYINAQIDYKYKHNGGPNLQQISPLPGDYSGVYSTQVPQGIIRLTDTAPHDVLIEVKDANGNISKLEFKVRYNPALAKAADAPELGQLIPQMVNVFEQANFEAYTTEYSVYDTVNILFKTANVASAHALSPLFTFCSAAIPVQDYITVRLKPTQPISEADTNCIVIKSTAGSRTALEKAKWKNDWLWARFRQLGTYQAFIDREPPTINAPGTGDIINLHSSSRIVFYPKDNMGVIKSFRAELDGQWLMFSNDKGSPYIYKFDEHFPAGVHQLTVRVEDIAGNITEKSWKVRK